MTWDKFWKYATNTAKTIYILFLIGIGIKLLLWLIFSFVPYKPFFPFEQPDWNPVATFVGALVTAIATFCAVFLTSWQDRKARKNECNYKYVQEKLFKLYDLLGILQELNHDYFSKDKKTSIKIVLFNRIEPQKISELLEISMQLQYFNISFKDKLSEFDKITKNFLSIQCHLIDVLDNSKGLNFVQRDSRSITVQLQNFFTYIKQEDENIDISDKTTEIYEIRELVLKQFKLED